MYVYHDEPCVWMMVANTSVPVTRNGSPVGASLVSIAAADLLHLTAPYPAALLSKEGSTMITEIAQIDVKPGTEAEFESGVKNAVAIFKRAKGCRSMELQRSIEKPSRYRLFVGWETLENHTVDFRGSADFQEWRKLVGHCFAAPPDVEHVSQVTRGF
jgi:heme-degrading monooxygenase HmoA